jgi:CBS domain-containing protein
VSSDNEETPGRRQHLFRGRRVKVRDLVDAKLLEAGAILVLDRPQAGESLQVTVTETGHLQLPDGREAGTPSGAIKDLTGKNVDGWYAWRTADDGRLIHDLRQRLLEQAVREGPDEGAADLEARQDEFLASALKAAVSGSPRQMTVRELIGVWGARGRDFGVNEQVDADLNNHGLTTLPDFRAVTLDDTVTVIHTTQAASDEAPAAIAEPPSSTLATSPQISISVNDDEAAWDHGLTIGNLPSASKTVSSVAPDATFDEAITKMLIADYSQLAVMAGPRDLKGAVSWKSIAKARNANPDAKLSAAIIKADAVPYTADLIDMLPLIQSKEFVFVLGADRSVTGIVTLADVVDVYGQMASPFFMIGRIDQRLRRIIEAIFPMETITALCDPDGQRGLHGYDQLTMGDYQRILENSDCWDNLYWRLDRKIFCARLDKIAKARNNLMHFNNDPLPDDVVSMLQNFLNTLQEYGD